MPGLPRSACELLATGPLGHLVTLNRDGSPQVSIVWVGVEGDDLVTAHLQPQQKLRNVELDPRVVLSFEGRRANAIGLWEYLVVHGRARIEAGGAPELLQELAYTYIGPGVSFPPMPDPPPGWRLRIAVERVGGVGPWAG